LAILHIVAIEDCCRVAAFARMELVVQIDLEVMAMLGHPQVKGMPGCLSCFPEVLPVFKRRMNRTVNCLTY